MFIYFTVITFLTESKAMGCRISISMQYDTYSNSLTIPENITVPTISGGEVGLLAVAVVGGEGRGGG